MPSWQEIYASAYGAYRLAWLDSSGMNWFNLTLPGFWRSFAAALVVAPPYAVILILHIHDGIGDIGWYFLVESVSYVIGWVAFPVIMAGVTMMFSFHSTYVPFIIAYNWSSLVQVAVVLPVLLLNATGLLPPTVGALLGILVTGAILFYQWFVAKTALRTTTGMAIAVVVLDFVIGRLINAGADRLVAAG